jgi:hypothetical protein
MQCSSKILRIKKSRDLILLETRPGQVEDDITQDFDHGNDCSMLSAQAAANGVKIATFCDLPLFREGR